ncbi:B78 [miniopterid betaherpesvirus 1]|uniref:B78 n=1 Tax=miniopterid betaherpesvirus 1 TaxID=3070189 RepID=I3VQ72_9BETA|nr:B78 [miniopterid betaherpesvirus 1]AFK83916.1 B78 [miniopterid betaherpesvirus 1]
MSDALQLSQNRDRENQYVAMGVTIGQENCSSALADYGYLYAMCLGVSSCALVVGAVLFLTYLCSRAFLRRTSRRVILFVWNIYFGMSLSMCANAHLHGFLGFSPMVVSQMSCRLGMYIGDIGYYVSMFTVVYLIGDRMSAKMYDAAAGEDGDRDPEPENESTGAAWWAILFAWLSAALVASPVSVNAAFSPAQSGLPAECTIPVSYASLELTMKGCSLGVLPMLSFWDKATRSAYKASNRDALEAYLNKVTAFYLVSSFLVVPYSMCRMMRYYVGGGVFPSAVDYAELVTNCLASLRFIAIPVFVIWLSNDSALATLMDIADHVENGYRSVLGWFFTVMTPGFLRVRRCASGLGHRVKVILGRFTDKIDDGPAKHPTMDVRYEMGDMPGNGGRSLEESDGGGQPVA